MNNKKENMKNLIMRCNELRLIGFIDGKEIEFKVDYLAKAMLLGYINEKSRLKKV